MRFGQSARPRAPGQFDRFFPVEAAHEPMFRLLYAALYASDDKRYVVHPGARTLPCSEFTAESLASREKCLGEIGRPGERQNTRVSVDIAARIGFSPLAGVRPPRPSSMIYLVIWLAAALLFGTLWAVVGWLLACRADRTLTLGARGAEEEEEAA